MAIVIEDEVDINKTATALIMGVLCWCFVGSSTGMENSEVLHKLDESLAEISQVQSMIQGSGFGVWGLGLRLDECLPRVLPGALEGIGFLP